MLPFANRSPSPDDEYFADGMTDELINALAKVPGLHVVSRTSCFAFKGRSEDAREIGRRLQVATVLEGSIRRAGRRLRVATQLINVADGFLLWSESFDREAEDVFAIQDEIARAISSALRGRLLDPRAEALVRRPTQIKTSRPTNCTSRAANPGTVAPNRTSRCEACLRAGVSP